jgi:hypothetical protein
MSFPPRGASMNQDQSSRKDLSPMKIPTELKRNQTLDRVRPRYELESLRHTFGARPYINPPQEPPLECKNLPLFASQPTTVAKPNQCRPSPTAWTRSAPRAPWCCPAHYLGSRTAGASPKIATPKPRFTQSTLSSPDRCGPSPPSKVSKMVVSCHGEAVGRNCVQIGAS